MPEILVAYATKYGSTGEIADKIGESLRENGFDVRVASVQRVEALGSFRAVVLGSGVYAGRWRKDAARFLISHKDELAQCPLWLFSSGPAGSGDPVELTKGWRFPQNLQPIASFIKPRDVALFHGVLDASRMNILERILVKMIKAPVGDFRDWNAIAAWAASIANSLKDQDSQKG